MGTVGTVQKTGIAGPICTFSINISALKHFERLIILMTHSVTRKSGIMRSCCLSMSCCSPLLLVPFCCHANLAVFAVLTKHLNFHTVEHGHCVARHDRLWDKQPRPEAQCQWNRQPVSSHKFCWNSAESATTVNKYRVWRSFAYCVETAQRVQFYMAYIERRSLEFPLIVVKQDYQVKSFSLSLSSRFRGFFLTSFCFADPTLCKWCTIGTYDWKHLWHLSLSHYCIHVVRTQDSEFYDLGSIWKRCKIL